MNKGRDNRGKKKRSRNSLTQTGEKETRTKIRKLAHLRMATLVTSAEKAFTSALESRPQERTELLQQTDRFEVERFEHRLELLAELAGEPKTTRKKSKTSAC